MQTKLLQKNVYNKITDINTWDLGVPGPGSLLAQCRSLTVSLPLPLQACTNVSVKGLHTYTHSLSLLLVCFLSRWEASGDRNRFLHRLSHVNNPGSGRLSTQIIHLTASKQSRLEVRPPRRELNQFVSTIWSTAIFWRIVDLSIRVNFCQLNAINPLTAGAAYICFFTFFISTLHTTF